MQPQTRTRPEPRLARAASVLLVLAGVLVLLYPVAATLYTNDQHAHSARQHLHEASQLPDTTRHQALAAARAYNAALTGVPILDPWLTRVDEASGAYRTYSQTLNQTDAMARVRVPAIDVDLPVRHGTGTDALASGLGHLYGTALPVGGPDTHAVLSGHTGMSNATMLDRLTELTTGDLIYIDILGDTLTYRVDQILVVRPDQTHELERIDGHDYLTLFTCTPYGSNSHRLLVRGERIPSHTPQTPSAPTDTPHPPLPPWMWWMVIPALLALSTLIALTIRQGATSRRQAR